MGMKLSDITRNLEQKLHIRTVRITTEYLLENQVEKAYYGTNMVLLRKDHAP